MKIIGRLESADGRTTKYLQRLDDGFVIETSYINLPAKHIVCFSSLVGCPMRCSFCASGMRPLKTSKRELFRRQLTAAELVEQCLNIVTERDLLNNKPLLFSCMGEGEPFLNYTNVVTAFHRLEGLSPHVRLAVSTVGVFLCNIMFLAGEEFFAPIKLQISLHAPNDTIRRQLIPTAQPLNQLVTAGKLYQRFSGRTLEWNYVLIDGVNDAPEHAHELAKLLGSGQYVKLNQLNPVPTSNLRPSTPQAAARFSSILTEHGLTAEHYRTDGLDVYAACGQLSYKTETEHS